MFLVADRDGGYMFRTISHDSPDVFVIRSSAVRRELGFAIARIRASSANFRCARFVRELLRKLLGFVAGEGGERGLC